MRWSLLIGALCAVVWVGCYSRTQLKPRATSSPATVEITVQKDALMAPGLEVRTEALLRTDVLSHNIAVPVTKGSPADLKLEVIISGSNFTAATAYEWRLVEARSGRIVAQGTQTPSLGHEEAEIVDVVLARLIALDTRPYASDPNGAVAAPSDPEPASGGPLPTSGTEGDKAWAVIIGVESYRNDLAKALHAEEDARAFAALAQTTLGVPEANIKLLIGERAARSDIAGALFEWLPRNAVEEGGRVYVFFSGHGAPNVDTGEAYLVPYDADPAYLKTGGISIAQVQTTLGDLKGQRAYLFVDACFSGSGERSVLPKGARPLVPVKEVAEVGGVITLSAAGATQTTGIHDKAARGLFTHHLIEGMSGAADANGDRDVTLGELIGHVTGRVEAEARRQNRTQRPSARLPGGTKADALVLVKKLEAAP